MEHGQVLMLCSLKDLGKHYVKLSDIYQEIWIFPQKIIKDNLNKQIISD